MADDYNSAMQQALNGPAGQTYNYVAGDWISGNLHAKEMAKQQGQMDYAEWLRNEYSAQQQRAFQEYMDSTKTQRAMRDIEAAGLNPWLALQSAGFGGSVPSSASASSSAGQVAMSGSSPAGGLGLAAGTAFGLAKLIQVIAKLVK